MREGKTDLERADTIVADDARAGTAFGLQFPQISATDEGVSDLKLRRVLYVQLYNYRKVDQLMDDGEYPELLEHIQVIEKSHQKI